MNPIKAVASRLHSHKGFTYVMDSTLWECDSCGERLSHLAKIRHPEELPQQGLAGGRRRAEDQRTAAKAF